MKNREQLIQSNGAEIARIADALDPKKDADALALLTQARLATTSSDLVQVRANLSVVADMLRRKKKTELQKLAQAMIDDATDRLGFEMPTTETRAELAETGTGDDDDDDADEPRDFGKLTVDALLEYAKAEGMELSRKLTKKAWSGAKADLVAEISAADQASD